MKKVALKLFKKTIPAKGSFGKACVMQMGGNANFPTPQPPLLAITNAANALDLAYEKALNGSEDDTADMYVKERLLDQLLTGLGNYVEFTANQNAETAVAVILSAGMEVKKQGSVNIPILGAAKGVEPGSVKLRRKAVRGSAYVWDMSEDGINWTNAGESTIASFIITDLESLKRYWFRVATVKRQTQGEWSDAITFVVS